MKLLIIILVLALISARERYGRNRNKEKVSSHNLDPEGISLKDLKELTDHANKYPEGGRPENPYRKKQHTSTNKDTPLYTKILTDEEYQDILKSREGKKTIMRRY